ncbi:MAG: L-threonylcarbamoyladenylate synthase [Planctomycetota bacterium]|jgi:protein-tyrosine phosphatase
MQTRTIKINDSSPDMAEIKQAADAVDNGQLAAIPTETVYGIACRAKTGSIERLNGLKNRSADKYYTLHIGNKNDISNYVPKINLRAKKLIQNCWPGPLTIVFEMDSQDSAKQRRLLGDEVSGILYKDNSIGIRCPDNPVASELLEATVSPIIAPSANITGQPPAINPEQVLEYFDGQIELLLDGGACKYKKSSTIVKIGKENLEILREGVYSKHELDTFSTVKFLFVCTGNTCRSPMAEGMFKKYLAEKLHCNVDQLDKKGYILLSAGTMGIAEMPASPEVVTACANMGIDMKSHKSTALSKSLIDECDYIFAMSRGHCEHIGALSPKAKDKCMLLADRDISDPIGQSQQVYNNCAEMIEKAISKRISELVI